MVRNVTVSMGRAGRPVLVVAVCAGAGAAGSATAAAAEVGWPAPTAQAVAMEAEFLVDPAYPPAVPTAVCEIDSGVADDAVGEFGPGQVVRYAMRDGDPVSDTHAERHGTWMARFMGAAVDGSGMVGLWPGVRIVSIRALVGEGQEFPYRVYKGAIDACLRLQSTGVPIVAISLSLGGSASPALDEVEKLRDGVAISVRRGVSVFAATGNEPGPVLSPAREPGVVGVGAGAARPDASDGTVVGQLCRGMAGEPPASGEGRDVIGPGCFLDGAAPVGAPWQGGGTSYATALVAALYAAARAYAPAAPPATVEEALVRSAQASERGGWVSGRALFAALDVDWVGLRRAGSGIGPGTDDPDPVSAVRDPIRPRPAPIRGLDTTVRYSRPALVRRARRGRVLNVAVAPATRPAGASLYVRALDRRHHVVARRSSRRRSAVALRLPLATRSVDVRFRSEVGTVPDSEAVRWTTSVGRAWAGSPDRSGEFG